ncbi:CGL129 [Auxenochlorella protothecoides x Auxenochlorella symbiontica]
MMAQAVISGPLNRVSVGLRGTASRPGSLAGRPLAPTSWAPRPTSRPALVRAQKNIRPTANDANVDVDKYVKDLQAKWDKVDNKTSVVVYGVGALVLLWLSSTIVGALNSVPLVPRLLELVGLGYTGWFTYRYLLFKSSREELLDDIESLKSKIAGEIESK